MEGEWWLLSQFIPVGSLASEEGWISRGPMARKYIYGIIPAGEETRLRPLGPEGDASLEAIPYRGLACVVRDHWGLAFADLPREALVRQLLAHQTVCEQVMERRTILPVKLGTVLEGEEEVLAVLQQGYTRFSQALAQIEGKWEFEVAATWDLYEVFQQIGQEEEVRRFKERATSSPAGDTLEERVLLGKMVKDSLERRRDHYRRPMVDYLKDLALDVQENALLRDELVLNVALLVERTAEAELTRRVRELDQRFHDEINFRIIGPLPPYSFSTVEVTRPALEELEAARLLLGLGVEVCSAEVRQAYRKLVAVSHPDVNREDPVAGEKVNRLTQAASLLTGYCRGQDADGLDAGQGRVSLATNGAKTALIIGIKRTAPQPAWGSAEGAHPPLPGSGVSPGSIFSPSPLARERGTQGERV
jgi:hypothetical protein